MAVRVAILHVSMVILIFPFKLESIGSTRVLVFGCWPSLVPVVGGPRGVSQVLGLVTSI